MNNSKIAQDSIEQEFNQTLDLEKKRGEIIQVIEAINGVTESDDWRKLKRLLLDGVVTTLEKHLMNETSKPDVNLPEVYRLQGQLAWAKKYTDLKKLSDWYKRQVENINNQINGQNPRDGAL